MNSLPSDMLNEIFNYCLDSFHYLVLVSKKWKGIIELRQDKISISECIIKKYYYLFSKYIIDREWFDVVCYHGLAEIINDNIIKNYTEKICTHDYSKSYSVEYIIVKDANLNALKYFIKNQYFDGIYPTLQIKDVFDYVCIYENFEMLEYLLTIQCCNTDPYHASMKVYFEPNKYPYDQFSREIVIINGRCCYVYPAITSYEMNSGFGYAASNGSIKVMEYLISKGTSPDHNHLISAVSGDSIEAYNFLKQYIKPNYNELLYHAIKNRHLNIVKLLSSNISNWDDDRYIRIIAENDDLDMFKFLLEKNIKYDLRVMVKCKAVRIVEYIISRGTKVSYDVFLLACEKNNLDIVKYYSDHYDVTLDKETMFDILLSINANILRYLVKHVKLEKEITDAMLNRFEDDGYNFISEYWKN